MRQLVSHVSTDYAAFAVTAFVVLIVTLFYLFLLDRKKNKLSCPGLEPSDSESGNLTDMKKAGSFHEFLVDLHKRYGPVASFWWGKQLAVTLGSPKVFKEVQTLFNRTELPFLMLVPLIGKHSIQFANDGRGRKMRQVLDRSFSHSATASYAAIFNEIGDEIVKKWKTIPEDEHVPAREYMLAMVLKAIMLTSFGDFFKSHKQIVEFEKAYDICWGEMESRLMDGLPDPGSDREKKFEEGLRKMKDMTQKVIADRKGQPDKTKHLLIDVILEDRDVFPTDDTVFANVITYIIGGFHTTGNLLTWVLHFLSLHPECQEKLFAEIKEIVKDDTVTADHINELKYTRQVLDETLRCSNLAPIAARYSDYEIIIDGHVIPQKTPIILSLGSVLQDPEIWPEPSRFDPERFNPENVKQRHDLAFAPFGFAGKRKCPGYRFSYFEATVFLVKLVKNFKIHMVEDTDLKVQYQLVTQLSNLWITLEKRV